MPPQQARKRIQQPPLRLAKVPKLTSEQDPRPEPRVEQSSFQPARVEEFAQDVILRCQGAEGFEAGEEDGGGGLQAGVGGEEDVFGVQEREGGEEGEQGGEGEEG